MENNKNIKVLVTGGTSGLGFETARLLLKEGYTVCATGRNFDDKGEAGDRFFFVRADFSSLQETQSAVTKITDLIGIPDVIINNAGILSPPDFALSDDAFELSFQVNFLSHLVINDLLVSQLHNDNEMLIVSVTSPVYRYAKSRNKLPGKDDYSAIKVYAESKYHLLCIGDYLAEKYPEKKLSYIGFNPGTFRSGIYRMQKQYFHMLYHIAAPFMRSPLMVAGRLVEIIRAGKLINGRVYRSAGKMMKYNDLYTRESAYFLESCFSIVESRLK